MGASNSKVEVDRSLQLCHDRKKYVKKALDDRCFLADTHITCILSLRNTGRALREFFELEGPTESSLYNSTDATREPLGRNERHSSGLSFSSINDSPSPPLSPIPVTFQARHLEFQGSSSVSRFIEEKVASPVTGRVTAPNAPAPAPHNNINHPIKKDESFSAPSPPRSETLPWDYFDLSHPVTDELSSQEKSGWNEGLNRGGETRFLNAEDERKVKELNQNIFESEDDHEINFILERNYYDESDKDCDEPLPEGSVRKFENINMASDIMGAASVPGISSASTEISEILPEERIGSPVLSPLVAIASSVSVPVNLTKLVDIEENVVGSKACPKDLHSSMRDVDQLFFKASESGQEVLRLLEANKLHFRSGLPKQKGESKRSWCLNACFSYKEEPTPVPEDPAQANTRYLAWQQTMSARSFSSMDPTASQNARYDALENSTNDIYCMVSGSHASTLDRLYVWEKKLYDEVKASRIVRRRYDLKCKLLRRQESRAESANRVDKTRFVIKDLHSRIRVSIKRMESISVKIKNIRDNELQPQVEELAKGLGNMWETMHHCYKLQFDIISDALSNGTKIAWHHQQTTNHLQEELSLVSSSFTNSIAAIISYLQAINGWIKCVILPEKSSRKIRKHHPASVQVLDLDPPIFKTCTSWLQGLEKLPIQKLVAETSRHQKPSVQRSDSHTLLSSLLQFFAQLKTFSESSVTMYGELHSSIQAAKINYEQLLKPRP